jgi:DNA-binding NarL/FixJ family response regulator
MTTDPDQLSFSAPRAGPVGGQKLMPGEVRVAIVDMDRRVRVALAELLRVAGLDVVGTAGEPRGAQRLVARGAEVLIIDPRLPEVADGHALVDSLVRDYPGVRVVVMGWGDLPDSPMASVSSFVTKSAVPEEFVAATLAACGC